VLQTHRFSLIAVFLAVAVISGCAETGDFGRRREGLFEGKQGIDLPPQSPYARATSTDHETELRNRAVAFSINPEKPSLPTLDAIEWALGSDKDIYYARVIDHADLSVVARYRRVERDALNDLVLIPRFRMAACRVAIDDAKRIKALERAVNVPEADQRAALDRVHDNAVIGRAVERAMRERLDAYHAAIERLAAVSPDDESKRVSTSLDRLNTEIAKGDACPG
jgi:hypothetical protein